MTHYSGLILSHIRKYLHREQIKTIACEGSIGHGIHKTIIIAEGIPHLITVQPLNVREVKVESVVSAAEKIARGEG